MKRLVLASASPRRKALLAALGLVFDVLPADIEEQLIGNPQDIAIQNAREKCEFACKQATEPAVVIAADTLVFLDSQILGKPKDLSEARRMLSFLSGKTHSVITGLAVGDLEKKQILTDYEITKVTFRVLSPKEIDVFVDVVNPLDRAGAYTVDGPGSLLVERYEGCFYNVLGLPIVRLDCLLKKLGMSLFDEMKAEDAKFL
ncbi:MAG TPA: Maf family protein [Candidatus Hydrogenedentes bacterium]|nr:Maf family protein [Candidatus Hydrogenedentota bacterium]HOL75560.1 Maf family protein [Candidatus Hydrogenedentota bacterium]HPO87015.1 Maf family protein [Candidatus Hydrogenedentota bacterium]